MGIADFYHYIIEEAGDPRTKDWFLVHSPVPLAVILSIYCYLVFVWGPSFMKNREAYSLKTYIKYYNIFQIISNAALVYGTATSGWTTGYSLGCVPMDPSTSGEGYRMATVVWWTYMIKLLDLSETIIFLLRKKDRQISTLHVYHHISTAFVAWMCIKWIPGGMLSSIMLVNCLVHVIMYTYYYMSAAGPTQRALVQPLKPWITTIQMTQFCVLMAHVAQGFAPSCNVPKATHAVVILHLVMNFYLFNDFYNKTYKKKKIS